MTEIDWHEVVRLSAERTKADRALDTPAGMIATAPLIENMPIALWQVDARPPGAIFQRLRELGITDVAAYLAEHPGLIELAASTVKVLHANRAAMDLTGAPDRALLLESVSPIFSESRDAAARLMCARYAGALSHLDQFTLRRFDGSSIEVLLLVTYPAPPETLDKTFLIALDVTERRARLERSDPGASPKGVGGQAETRELVSLLAHEIRQPLSAISAYGQALIRWLDRPDFDRERANQILQRIIDSTEIANDVVARVQAMAVDVPEAMGMIEANDAIRAALKDLSGNIKPIR